MIKLEAKEEKKRTNLDQGNKNIDKFRHRKSNALLKNKIEIC